MTEEQAKKGIEILEELNELRKINELLDNKYGHNINVRFHQHYGECGEHELVQVDKRHLHKFLKVLREVIQEVEQELNEL